jgi:chemotaxis protein MotB
MARKQKHEEHENHERWLVSYADFITLLFAFFVVMYSLSAVNEGRFKILSEALEAAFRGMPRSMDPVQLGQAARSPATMAAPVPLPVQQNVSPNISLPMPPQPTPPPPPDHAKRDAEMQRLADEIREAMAPLMSKDLLRVRRTTLGVEVEINTNILFASASADIAPAARDVLKEIAGILADFPNPVRVEGFTDNLPIRSAVYPSNWELSAGRAASVVHLFMDTGIAPGRMAAVGFGEHQPVADNATDQGRRRNRRVNLVILADRDLRQLRDMPTTAPDTGADTGAETGADPGMDTGTPAPAVKEPAVTGPDPVGTIILPFPKPRG